MAAHAATTATTMMALRSASFLNRFSPLLPLVAFRFRAPASGFSAAGNAATAGGG